MSAFIVSEHHIDAIVRAALALKVIPPFQGDHNRRTAATNLGQLLTFWNYKSVNHRYGRKDVAPTYEFTEAKDEIAHTLTAAQVIRACQCLDYQSCETDDWETSVAHKMLTKIILAATYHVPEIKACDTWAINETPEIISLSALASRVSRETPTRTDRDFVRIVQDAPAPKTEIKPAPKSETVGAELIEELDF